MASLHTSEAARKRLRRRYRAERLFKILGLTALLVAFSFLVFFLANIARQAWPAFFQHSLQITLTVPPDEATDFDMLLRDHLRGLFPSVETRAEKRALANLVSAGAPVVLRREAMRRKEAGTYEIAFSDTADLYFKGDYGRWHVQPLSGVLSLSATTGAVTLTTEGESWPALNDGRPLFVKINGGVIKLLGAQGQVAEGEVLLPPSATLAENGKWQLVAFGTPQANRKLDDRSLVFLDYLKERGLVVKRASYEFFACGASREAEMAGIYAALIGSLMTLLVTLVISFPVSVAAAIYLEEFAPRNRLTELIEVNINNLAAVPSIIFGLLGLAVFINVFGMPRSSALVGGLVLALMTMPIIIIASRAALRSVPPSVKEAALGLGASHVQAVFHHVLPLAVPGILTGTILGTARALGETAPLLLIGMVAFVVEPPGGFMDAATLLPVQIFMWTDFPEIAFQHKTAAAILVLLTFLGLLNFSAVLLRRRFERRW